MRMISPLVMWRNRICIETYAGLKNEESLVEAFKVRECRLEDCRMG
ncbi:hypothetical protein I306_00826 [Cryptococcus gattii EJB2]|uniref:Uncharacterized protein n=1 Tax=Cryptococcus gattii EJB2 TaxID=1296103 RepID=A0ABR5C2G2_9TREE|nr:hypothetical protein I306_00826 [Cryptococcus gattii EJB2]KJD99496.1 hypothetical protein I311_06918 [Cryptococcus gattii NT-10]